MLRLDKGRTTLAAGVVAYGVALALHALGALHPTAGTLLNDGWPLLLALYGLLWLIEIVGRGRGGMGDSLFATGLVFVGGLLGLSGLHLVDLPANLFWSLFWAAVVVAVGIWLLRGAGRIDVRCRPGAAGVFAQTAPAGPRPHGPHRGRMLGDTRLGWGGPWDLRSGSIQQGIGDITLDLTRANIPDEETVIALSLWVGDVEVILPRGLAVSVRARVSLGEATVMGRTASGVGHPDLVYESPDFATAQRRVRMDVRVSVGDITVSQVG
jgi:lia operon protein LiaF